MNLTVNSFDRKCRICATEIQDFTCGIPIFGSGLYLDGKIWRYLYIDVTMNDSLPKTICATCFIKIESIDKFAYLATKTQEAFKGWQKKGEQIKSDPDSSNKSMPSRIPSATTNLFEYITSTTKNTVANYANNEEAIKKIILKTFRNPRNPRHVDHVTLEQIINDQIVKNAKIPLKSSYYDDVNSTFDPPEIMPIIEFNDLKLGQLIKDPELLQLILKSLKWIDDDVDDPTEYDNVLAKLRNSSLKEVLSNTNLLKDEDIMKLIKSYVGHDASLNHTNSGTTITPQYSVTKIETPSQIGENDSKFYNNEEVSQMEVDVDPNLFLPYDDDDEEEKERKKESVEIVALPLKIEQPNKESVEIVPIPMKTVAKEEKVQDDTLVSHQALTSLTKLENTGKLICTSCESTFLSATDLQHHVLTQHLIKKNDQPEDLVIEKKIKTAEPKRRAKKRDRKKNNTFVCPICQIKLSTKGNLKVHIERGAHKPKEKFKCDDCRKLFKTIANLLRHKRCHHSSEQKKERASSTLSQTCDLCDQTFTQNKDLKFHMKNDHNEENPNKCPHCPKIFTNSRHFEAHQKRMHAEMDDLN